MGVLLSRQDGGYRADLDLMDVLEGRGCFRILRTGGGSGSSPSMRSPSTRGPSPRRHGASVCFRGVTARPRPRSGSAWRSGSRRSGYYGGDLRKWSTFQPQYGPAVNGAKNVRAALDRGEAQVLANIGIGRARTHMERSRPAPLHPSVEASQLARAAQQHLDRSRRKPGAGDPCREAVRVGQDGRRAQPPPDDSDGGPHTPRRG